jgi:hypothetical protein
MCECGQDARQGGPGRWMVSQKLTMFESMKRLSQYRMTIRCCDTCIHAMVILILVDARNLDRR